MALRRIDRRTAPESVYDQLLGEMLDGELQPGAALPAERQLAEALGVSRPTVREAMQRLAHGGLVEVRQGGATTVRDFRRAAGLDLLPRLILRAGRVDDDVLRSILETRSAMGREVAGLAAERGGADAAGALNSAVESLAAQSDPLARQLAALGFWDHVVDAADSIVYRLLFNDLRAVYEPAMAALVQVMAAEVDQIDRYRALAEAIIAGDAIVARQTAAQLLATATTEFDMLMRRLEENTP
ncbi:GntR family transcriptional regulator [Nocardia sp. CA2R105]|uniref:FadR/GntR family transcriptional regulator n=1 Tax=Nocardia coffeae TaxID=2873381 RepID=UPI001CA7AE80|nr:GntR family transcriptional regulator [Nocardia coffeae]MBY8862167.1 GntR family transcriptional regulator [Nocardia coffeae]